MCIQPNQCTVECFVHLGITVADCSIADCRFLKLAADCSCYAVLHSRLYNCRSLLCGAAEAEAQPLEAQPIDIPGIDLAPLGSPPRLERFASIDNRSFASNAQEMDDSVEPTVEEKAAVPQLSSKPDTQCVVLQSMLAILTSWAEEGVSPGTLCGHC